MTAPCDPDDYVVDDREGRDGVHVVDVSRSQVREDVQRTVEAAGLTLDEFMAQGAADELIDERLRDLWLMTRRALT